MARSSSGLGHGPLKADTRVRLPYALPVSRRVRERFAGMRDKNMTNFSPVCEIIEEEIGQTDFNQSRKIRPSKFAHQRIGKPVFARFRMMKEPF